MPVLPAAFTAAPLAHRGLHGGDVPENSLAAAQAAIDAGYGIEVDIQPASDGTPMVFHDYDLARMAGERAFIRALSPQDLAARRLAGGTEPIPQLAQLLELVAGRVPVLIEIKDPDGRLGPNIGDLHARVAETLRDYAGPVAVMSFNPAVVKAFHAVMPQGAGRVDHLRLPRRGLAGRSRRNPPTAGRHRGFRRCGGLVHLA